MSRKLDEKTQEAYQAPEPQEFVPDEEERSIIESYLKDNDYDAESTDIILSSFDSGDLTFDEFKEYAHLTDEDLSKYATTNSIEQE